MADAMVHISRDFPNDIKIRGLRVLIDGNQVVDLLYGRTFQTSVKPGPHVLKVTNTLSSKELAFEAKEGQTLKFRSGNKMPSIWSWMLVLVCVAPYRVILEAVDN